MLPTELITRIMSLDEKCKACLEDLPVEGTHVICSKCGGGLHYTCSSVSEASWHSMGQAKKNAWKCADCRTRKPLANQMLTRSGSNSSLASSSGDVGEGNRRDETFQLSGLEVLLNKKFKEFEKVIDKKIGKIEGRLQEIERGLEFVGNSVDDLKKSCKEIEKKVITVEKKQETMEAQNQELRKKVKDLEIAMQEMAQDLNQSKVEITGVPQNVNHSVFMEKVLEKINVVPAIGKTEYSIEKVEQRKVGTDPPRMKSLMTVDFKNKATRNRVIDTIKKNKVHMNTSLVGETSPQPIFINEALTPYMKKVFYETKKIKNDKGYQYLWIKDGHILLKKNEGSKVMRITCLANLDKL